MKILDQNYWQKRYENGEIGWDAGGITTPIKDFVDNMLESGAGRDLRILVPGAGSGYEAAYLWQQGFSNVYICDWAEDAIERFKKNAPDFPQHQILRGDFFELQGQYDMILEQTFFCALPPSLRPAYAQKCSELLDCPTDMPDPDFAWKGRLVGVMFGITFPFEGPPFGGGKEEYIGYFEPYFDILTMENCYNSIKPRENAELWVVLKKKSH